jgi:hypothetical protein
LEEVVFVFLDSWYFLGFEKVVIGQHLVYCACQRENVCIGEVFVADENFGRTILSCLNILGEMLVNETGIAEICNFEEEFVVQFDAHAFPV